MALQGGIGFLTRDRLRGWAFDTQRPALPVSLVVLADGEVVARALADRLRPDLIPHTKANGRHGFDIVLRAPLARGVRHLIEVRREQDGAHLPHSPRALEPAAAFDDAARAEWRAILGAAETDEDYRQRLDFLLQETRKLRVADARRRGGLEARERQRRLRWAGDTRGEAAPRRRALVLDQSMPDPTRDAGSNALLSHIATLQALGFDVSFAPADLTGDGARLEAMGVEVYTRPATDTLESLLELQRDAYDAVYLHRVTVASKYIELARAHQPRARIVYSVADLHHLRLARQAAVERRGDLMALAQRTRRQELTAAWAADAVVTHSSVEAQWLAKHVAPDRIVVVPWAVAPRPVKTPFAERLGLAFIAGFNHAPNVDAAHWLVDKIMPEVWRSDASVRLLLMGGQAPASLKALAGDRVEIVGWAPDLGPVFERVRVTVAPLAFGAGLKGKVLESLAAGVPCVCTPVAAEGFDFAPPLSQLVAEDPRELARLIVSMHQDAVGNSAAAQAGLQFVTGFASQEAVAQGLRRAFALEPAPV